MNNPQSSILNPQSSNYSPRRIIRWIVSFITLATFFFILPASCVRPPIGDYYRNKGSGGGSTDGDGVMPPSPTSITEAPGITSGGFSISVSVTMSHSLAGATIYYRAASDTTTDLSTAINPNDNTTYTGTGTSVSPTSFGPGNVYRIKAVAVATDGRVSPETAIQRFDYDIDSDDDGLIDIRNLEMLDNIRFNLAGTTYDDEALDTGTGDPGITTGGPTVATTACMTDPDGDTVFLCGYELMGNLDFTLATSYASGTVNTTWCPDTLNDCIGTTSGFPGIGPATGNTGGFTAIFEGNDNSISNFYSRNTANTNNSNIGLFALNSNSGTIRNIAVEANVFGGTMSDRIGGLVGMNSGTITASSATGSGSADGGDGDTDYVGGLVGQNDIGSITASFATGSADGGDGLNDYVGGLVGRSGGSITASYATGSADGGDGATDRVGGLVGENRGTITASYATGDADGGAGGDSQVGGLAGRNNFGTIIASYATGNVAAGSGAMDVGGGLAVTGTITASYSFGTVTGVENPGGTDGTTWPDLFGGVTITSATQLGDTQTTTTADAGTDDWWNPASSTTVGAWDFGTPTENPALVYSDYDGPLGTAYDSCSDDNGGFPDTIPGTTIPLICGTTLVGNFRAP